MSVILYTKKEVHQKMADAYEELKYVFVLGTIVEKTDEKFYKAMRQLYFCNVATWLYQYGKERAFKPEELAVIDSFDELKGNPDYTKKLHESLSDFTHAWTSLTYNLIANDGTQFIQREAVETIEQLIVVFTMELCDRIRQK